MVLVVGLVAPLQPSRATNDVAQAPTSRPNVLLIVTDDQRGLMSAMPATRRHFRRHGRRYPNAYVTTPLCCPSRASIMTGRYAHNHGVQHNGPLPRLRYGDMLQAELQAAGYRTALFGKYLNSWSRATAPPNFHEYATHRSGYRNSTYNVNGSVRQIDGYLTDVLGDMAVEFVRSQQDASQPWLLMLTPYAPHPPATPQRRYASLRPPRFRGNPATRETDRRDKPRWIRRHRRTPAATAAQLRTSQFRTLRSVDDMIGRVMRELRRTGQHDTLAIFTSDNGVLWGEHGRIRKGVPYTAAVKVPLFVRWPGTIEPGSVDRRIVANVDLAPTVLSALGLPISGRDGRDLLDRTWRRDRIHLEYWCNLRSCQRWASTRTRDYQYIEHYDARGLVTFREYYDLRRDRWQLSNLFADNRRGNEPATGPLRSQLRADRVCVGTGEGGCP